MDWFDARLTLALSYIWRYVNFAKKMDSSLENDYDKKTFEYYNNNIWGKMTWLGLEPGSGGGGIFGPWKADNKVSRTFPTSVGQD